MTGIIQALLEGKPIPVAVVADQQDLEKDATEDDQNEMEVTVGSTGMSPRQRQRRLMDMINED